MYRFSVTLYRFSVTLYRLFDLAWLPVQMEFTFDIDVGDVVDFIAHPRENQDCDGVYLVDIQYWKGDLALHTT
jgi:hypothetical protein